MTTELQQRQQIEASAARLHDEFEGVFAAETIERMLADSLQRLSDSRVQTFVPLLAERFARERLRAAAKAEGMRMTDTPTVLFLGVHNAGRSQMASGWLRHLAGDRVQALSGGSKPATHINPSAVKAMDEVGIDITSEYPKPWTDETVGAADIVVTMGCGDACPVIPGKRYLDWELDDPAGKGVDEVRPVRDEIESRVRGLLDDLGVKPVR